MDIAETIIDIFEQHADPVKAEEMSRYMRHFFAYCGISKPTRAGISKPILNELKHSAPDKTLIYTLWNEPRREFQYFCMDYLQLTKKYWSEDIIKDFEKLIITRSWWDTVDTLAIRMIGEYFKKWPRNHDRIIARWSRSKNLWLNRAAILFQLKYKDKTDTRLLYELIRKHCRPGEFFIQKAIGWALREYSYTDPASVRELIESTDLKPLSRREGSKRLNLA